MGWTGIFCTRKWGFKFTSILISKQLQFIVSDLTTYKDGRYVIISGLLEHKKVTLVNVYAPNTGQIKFLSNLATLLAQYKDSSVVIGGDFNLVNYAILDRSKTPLPADKALSASFNELQKMLGVTDAWRCVNLSVREYTFYSKVHNSYSRIDYLLLSISIMQNVINSEIHTSIISDHGPLSVTLSLDFYPNKTKPWKFNNMFLRDHKFVSMLTGRMVNFFKTNMNSVSSIQTLWEAFKVTCRGWCMCYGAAKRKIKRK